MAHSTLAVFPVSHFPQSIFDIGGRLKVVGQDNLRIGQVRIRYLTLNLPAHSIWAK